MTTSSNHPPDDLERVYCSMLGVEVTPVVRETLLKHVELLAQSGNTHVVVGHNLHSAYLYHVDSSLRQLYDLASIVIADGKPVEIDARRGIKRLQLETRCERLGSTDWILEFLARGQPGTIAIVGASPDANSKFVERIQKEGFPGNHVTGISGENWSRTKQAQVVSQLKELNPAVVFIGLGMPLQEHFVHQSLEKLPKAVYILIGGAIDQLTGTQALAPRWIGRIGLEWVWRLGSQPRRLSGRYLVEPWKLLLLRLRRVQ